MILVTGATGFVGAHVTRLLSNKGKNVRVLVRTSSQFGAIDGLSVHRVFGDLREPSSLKPALHGADQIFHVAADYRLWARDPKAIFDSNVVGTRNLIDAARKAGVERFVYTSTVATIAVPRHGELPNEDTRTKLDEMVGNYKRSKFLAEEEVLNAASKGFPAVIVNPTTPVGPGDWKPTPTGRIILDFLNGRMPAYVDTGLNLVAVEDVAEGHWLAAERGRVGERYILGGRNLTLKEILESLAAATGRTAPRLRVPHWFALAAGCAENVISALAGREPRIPLEGVRMSRHKMFVDCSKASRELGFQPGSVDAALKRAARWYADNGYLRHQGRGVSQETDPPPVLGGGRGW